MDCGAGWPAVIPWESTGGEPRFACDVMTEGLARQLRLCGLDATSAPEFGKNERFKAYRCVRGCTVLLPSSAECVIE